VQDIKTAQKRLLATLVDEELSVQRFEIVHPSLEDVFLRLTEQASTTA
jgi:ABC-type uncharacterized transport system ATPase subunit